MSSRRLSDASVVTFRNICNDRAHADINARRTTSESAISVSDSQ